MTEKDKSEKPEELENQNQSEPASDPDRKSSAFQAVTRQLSDVRKENASLQKQVATFLDKAKDDERSSLEEKQDFDKVKDSYVKEIEGLKSQLEGEREASKLEKLSSDFRMRAMDIGISNKFTLDGVLANFLAVEDESKDADKFLKSLKDDASNKALFASAGKMPALTTPAGATHSDESWKQIYADRDGRDAAKKRKALDEITAYHRKHGKFPPHD